MPGGQLPPWFVSFIQWAGPIVQIFYWASIPIILFMAYRVLRRFEAYYVPVEYEEEYVEVEEEEAEAEEPEAPVKKGKAKAKAEGKK